ncbi:hypothetical protein [uncultured Mediterranean phage uvDeep-CGR2-KM19-C37]|nr:hypothetical protein [uncultured Mediterranean phage uvDeep-CGR2-KM19-C37]
MAARKARCMMAVDMGDVMNNSQALTVDILGKSFGHLATRAAMIGDRKFDETDLIQASAAKELGKAGENPRYQPQSAPAASGSV